MVRDVHTYPCSVCRGLVIKSIEQKSRNSRVLQRVLLLMSMCSAMAVTGCVSAKDVVFLWQEHAKHELIIIQTSEEPALTECSLRGYIRMPHHRATRVFHNFCSILLHIQRIVFTSSYVSKHSMNSVETLDFY